MTGVFLGVLVFFPFLGGLLAAVAGKKHADYRDFLADIVVVFEFLTAFGLFSIQSFAGEATFAIDGICGMGLHFQADGFRLIYGAGGGVYVADDDASVTGILPGTCKYEPVLLVFTADAWGDDGSLLICRSVYDVHFL